MANTQRSLIRALANKEMFITLMMGFSSGLPLLLTLRTLQAWMTDIGVDLKTVGIFALVGLPYSVKFLWAPFFDHYQIKGWGRRRGWLLLCQVGLVISIFAMGFIDPKTEPAALATLAFLVAFFSASQDTVVDAYRRDALSDEDQGAGAIFYQWGYRIAMLISGAVAIGLAEKLSWGQVYFCMAGVMAIGIATTLWAPEPNVPAIPPRTIRQAVILPFREFLVRRGAILILLFVILYKIGEAMAGSMLTPFYFKMGYSKLEIAAVAKSFTVVSAMLGSFIGGVVVQKKGIYFSLLWLGIAQTLATLLIAVLTTVDKNLFVLGGIIFLDDVSTSMAATAFLAFLAVVTNRQFSATQFALFSGLAVVPRTIVSSTTGYLVEYFDWMWFFIVCAMITLPALFMIPVLKRFQKIES